MFDMSCHTWGFSDQPLEQAVQTITRLGFNYIDLGSGPHIDTDTAAKSPEEEAARIRKLLERFNLHVTDLYLLLPALASADEGRRAYEVRLFARLVPFAIALGAPGITLSPGIAPPEMAETAIHKPAPLADADGEVELEPPPPTPFDWAVASLREAVEIVSDTNLRLSFEPHLDSVAATPEKALQLLEAVPGLSLTLDWAQFIAQGFISRQIVPLLPHTAHVQLRQAAQGRLQTPYHEGTIDLRQVLTLLSEHDYRGAISVEYMNRSGWHGLAALDVVRETGLTRDAIRNNRQRLLAQT